MNRSQSSLAVAVAIVLVAAVVQAVPPPGATWAEPGTATAPPPATAAPGVIPAVDRSRLSPMHREVEALVEREKALVEELNRRFLAARLPAEMLVLQKEIEAVKKNGMLAVFEVQLRYAETEGRTVAAEQLRATIEAIRNPKRPAPAGP